MTIIFLFLAETIMTLYLSWIHRLLLESIIRKKHSKTYLKKRKITMSKWNIFWYAFLDQNLRSEIKWITPSILIYNLNLFSIPVYFVFSLLIYHAAFSWLNIYKLFTYFAFKDGILWLLLFVLIKLSRNN